MKKTNDYYKYAVCNGLYRAMDGADKLEEAKYLALIAMKDAIDRGMKVTKADFHIYRMNPETGVINYNKDYLNA